MTECANLSYKLNLKKPAEFSQVANNDNHQALVLRFWGRLSIFQQTIHGWPYVFFSHILFYLKSYSLLLP